MKLTFTSQVKDQRISRNVSQQIADYIATFDGKAVEITVDKLRSKRSAQQNKLWWIYMTILSKELGYSKNEIHEICKFKLLKKTKVDETTGEELTYLGSTASLNKSDFADLVSELQRWAAETFNIVLPEPNQQLTID